MIRLLEKLLYRDKPRDGLTPTSVHYDEVDPFDPIDNMKMSFEMLRRRNDRRMQWMVWEAALPDLVNLTYTDEKTGLDLPYGYLPADGRTLSRSEYPALHKAISGLAEPWLDLGGIEFDFGSKTRVWPAKDATKLLEFARIAN